MLQPLAFRERRGDSPWLRRDKRSRRRLGISARTHL